MNCIEATTWMNHDLDGELSDAQRALLTGHVAKCDVCSAYRDALVSVDQTLRRSNMSSSCDLCADVMGSIGGSRPSRRKIITFRIVEVAAAALFVVAVGLSLMHRNVAQEEEHMMGVALAGAVDALPAISYAMSDDGVTPGRAFVVREGVVMAFEGATTVSVSGQEEGEPVLRIDAFPVTVQ